LGRGDDIDWLPVLTGEPSPLFKGEAMNNVIDLSSFTYGRKFSRHDIVKNQTQEEKDYDAAMQELDEYLKKDVDKEPIPH
jgi:DNA transposition AAA+ family ATPase